MFRPGNYVINQEEKRQRENLLLWKNAEAVCVWRVFRVIISFCCWTCCQKKSCLRLHGWWILHRKGRIYLVLMQTATIQSSPVPEYYYPEKHSHLLFIQQWIFIAEPKTYFLAFSYVCTHSFRFKQRSCFNEQVETSVYLGICCIEFYRKVNDARQLYSDFSWFLSRPEEKWGGKSTASKIRSDAAQAVLNINPK